MKINKSASRAIQILLLLSNSTKALTQLEVSQALDIPRSSTFEIMYTLMENGVIEFDNEDLKTFKLSMKLFEIGFSVLSQTDLYKVAQPFLEALSAEIGETVFLGMEDGGDVVYLDRVEKRASSITTVASIGMRRPIHCTGLGKAILAAYPIKRVQEIWNMSDRSTAYTKTTILTFEGLLKDLEDVRKRGYAIDNRERENEIFCVAVPIYRHDGRAIAAISIASIYLKMDKKRVKTCSDMLIDTALKISKKLGYQKEYLYQAR